LLFFGVAEPVLHYASPPTGAALTVDAAKQAMQIAFFHWGFHICSQDLVFFDFATQVYQIFPCFPSRVTRKV